MKKPSPSENGDIKKNPSLYELTVNGSLGLLALGAVGIKAWRAKRAEVLSTLKHNQGNE